MGLCIGGFWKTKAYPFVKSRDKETGGEAEKATNEKQSPLGRGTIGKLIIPIHAGQGLMMLLMIMMLMVGIYRGTRLSNLSVIVVFSTALETEPATGEPSCAVQMLDQQIFEASDASSSTGRTDTVLSAAHSILSFQVTVFLCRSATIFVFVNVV